MKINTFAELKVWQRAHELTLEVCSLAERFPASERFGMVAQLRRCATSGAANIAEGFARRTTKEMLRSWQIAGGELEETRCFILLSRDLRRISPADFAGVHAMCDSVRQLMNALGRSLKNRSASAHEAQVTNHDPR